MTTNYPTSLDSFSAHSNGDTIEASHVNNLQDAVAALEAKVGVDGSAVTGSLDYRVDALESASGGGGDGSVPPEMHGFLAWSTDPAMGEPSSEQALVSGQSYVVALWAPGPLTVTNVHVQTTTSGTATAAYAAIYDTSGSLLRQSSSSHAQFGSIGVKDFVLTTPLNVPAGKFYVMIWATHSSSPTIMCTSARSWGAGTVGNVNLSAAASRFATADSGLTSTAPATMGTKTAGSRCYWVAVS